ncbi:CPBP family intramembrane metalloprotease [Photobacterium sp. WH77]|uniref:CPBP family intramembrane glutamic endopeptidase n=1 Tax=Photobacterium TaxID=657 RepID=UPI001EDC21CF|nr:MULTISPECIES: CPBP family intramembrane glutamic endopeptidase [Photobacterium]MCG2837605.1 CPBP family intramembrane metalloprotease [Photobacterium sp. WH77]MCG2845221.1 CPBP family intramembrane metalloprotease [Photobacterium sp. WH80]
MKIDKNDSTIDDFPFYNDKPAAFSPRQWLLLVVLVFAGFAVLITPIPLFATPFGQFIPAILFFAIPLFYLARIAPFHWRAIFRPMSFNHLKWMIGIGLLNLVISVLLGLLVVKLFGANPNHALAQLSDMTTVEKVLFFLKTLPQLFGEEIFTILPFLALMHVFYSHCHFSRTRSIILAWVITAVIFGLAHLPTYGWNLLQCLLVIGTARLVLSLAYLKTKSIWVSTGAHIINDWIMFSMALFVGAPTP